MNPRPFLQIGNVILAIKHIVSIERLHEDTVKVFCTNDTNPYNFHGHEARAVWKWASAILRCTPLGYEMKGEES